MQSSEVPVAQPIVPHGRNWGDAAS